MSSEPLLTASRRRCGDVAAGWVRRGLNVEEAKAQLWLALPMVVTNTAYFGVPLVSVMFAGHLGDLELAAATLANSWATVTGFALTVGFSGALETLCGQAYGAMLYRLLGIYLQSSLILSAIVATLISILWLYTEPVLLLLLQDPAVSHMAATYLRYLIPGIFAYSFTQCLLRYLQTQSMVTPLVICSSVPLVIHVGLTYALVYVLGLGFPGATVAASISLWLSFIMLSIYVMCSEGLSRTRVGFGSEVVQYLWPTLKLAMPSAIMVCLEYWAFELLVLLAGLLQNSQLSTSLIAMCVNTETIAYMITYGVSSAVSTRVSNEIGAGNILKARNAVSVALKLSVLLAMTFVLLLAFGHGPWASLFSKSDDIIREYAYMTPLLAISIVLDSIQGVLSGVSRGCGWQHLAAMTNLVAFYLIGMPVALLLTFLLSFGSKGLWIGLICGLFSQSCTLLLITLRTRWVKIESMLNAMQMDAS